ncbi:hypothetical protein V2J09_023621 [Rumex salicifolius]
MADDSCSSRGHYYSCFTSSGSGSGYGSPGVPDDVDVEISVQDRDVAVEIVCDDVIGNCSSGRELDTGSQDLTTSSSNFSGTIDADPSKNNIVSGETLTSDQPAKTRRDKKSRSLALLLSRLFDEKVPIRKKLKWMKRVATVKHDGTVELDVPGDIKPPSAHVGTGVVHGEPPEEEGDQSAVLEDLSPMQIVMLIVGTRGDVQPFVAIGKKLQEHGHRVRLATHSNFKEFVLSGGLEFYPLGGDPKVLAEYMVKNKGFLPSDPSEISIQRQQLKDIIDSLYPACKNPDPESNIEFEPDAIISNPPAYGHTHVAEALQIPLHIFFTMPWTPTSEFPHPLSRVKQPMANRNCLSNLPNGQVFQLSYYVVDGLIWLGMRDLINDFRKKKLKLRRVSYLSGSSNSHPVLPYGYIWSPHLVPKPKDWGPEIDVVGFCFLDLASNYKPPEELEKWLSEDPRKPIYIGFGSLPVQEPKRMTEIIVQALEMTGQRGIINKGWGGLGNMSEQRDFVYLLDNCPHDWLFLQCAAVVHHGGAGTTAAGLKAACPTTIVPFFGDQPFWGDQVHAKGIGPRPIPIDEFSLNKLVHAINFMLDPKVKERAVELAKAMEYEDGVTGAVNAFQKHYPAQKAHLELQKTIVSSHFFSLRQEYGGTQQLAVKANVDSTHRHHGLGRDSKDSIHIQSPKYRHEYPEKRRVANEEPTRVLYKAVILSKMEWKGSPTGRENRSNNNLNIELLDQRQYLFFTSGDEKPQDFLVQLSSSQSFLPKLDFRI